MSEPGAAAAFIAGLPKAELHVHLEGTLEPRDMFAFARRNDVRLPWSSERELVAAYDFGGLDDFLALYWQGCEVLCGRDDFYDLTMGYLRQAHLNGVMLAEMSFSPQNFLRRGIPLADQLDGISAAMDDARADLGIDAALIVVAQRHRPEGEGLDLLSEMRPHRDRLLGVGLGGPEVDHPPAKFARFYASARSEGYRLTIHAGEEGPAAFVAEALDACGAERIDHGFTAATDPDLVRRLADDGVALTMCPLSNLRLRVVDSLEGYPVLPLLRAGVTVTLNSDDPPYFGGHLNANYAAVAESLSLDRDTVAQIARNGFTGSFAERGSIDAGVAAVDAYVRGLATQQP